MTWTLRNFQRGARVPESELKYLEKEYSLTTGWSNILEL